MTVELSGERVFLDPGRALVWDGVVIIADPHFGKDASARARAIPVPAGTTAADLARLDALLLHHAARELWVLGDVFDSEHAREDATLDALSAWRRRHSDVTVGMVAGNHDRRALRLAEHVGFAHWPDLAARGPWRLAHHPVESPEGHVLCGHIHPGLRLRGSGRDGLRLPAFVLGARRSILPAFGGMTGLATHRPAAGERGYVIAGDRVLGPIGAGAAR